MFGVVDDVRAERLEAQPRRRFLLAGFVHEEDAAALAPALDSARHVVARELAFDALLQPIRLSRIKALADDRTQVVAHLLCQLGLRHPGDVGLLDDVVPVDVVVLLGRVLAAHDEEHARLPVGIHEGAHRGDVTRPLGLDASGECVEVLLLQRRAGERADLLAKAGTQAIDVEAGHLRRGDDRAFRDDGLLIGRGLGRGDQQGDE